MTLGGPRDSGAIPPPSTRGPRLLGGSRLAPGEGGRSLLIALVSTIVVFGIVGFIVVHAPGWEAFQQAFLSRQWFDYALPKVVDKFWVNVRLFLIAEVLILALGLVLAVMRSLPGPVFLPIRLLATIYVDVFRALPGLLVVYMLGLGIPNLGIEGIPKDPFFWGVVTLTLLYSAYVSEVYRAGIDSIHPSQAAAARSLGLSEFQALRYVVVPQAVRRVIPPLLNDFIGLQKDTALISVLGVVEAMQRAQLASAADFNYTPFIVAGVLFVLITVPQARFTDVLIDRDRRRQFAAMR
jgi:polar amino acid transport system permease protein